MGWWASDQASLYFDEVRVPAENMLGEEGRGFIQIMHNFNHERLGMVAQSLGMMRVCSNMRSTMRSSARPSASR